MKDLREELLMVHVSRVGESLRGCGRVEKLSSDLRIAARKNRAFVQSLLVIILAIPYATADPGRCDRGQGLRVAQEVGKGWHAVSSLA